MKRYNRRETLFMLLLFTTIVFMGSNGTDVSAFEFLIVRLDALLMVHMLFKPEGYYL